MTGWDLTSFEGACVFGQAIPPSVTEAVAYTLTKSQRDARKASADPSSDAYHAAMVQSLGGLGWRATVLGQYRYTPSSAQVLPLQIMAEALTSYLGHIFPFLPGSSLQPSTYVHSLASALSAAPTAVQQVMDGLWSQSKVSASVRSMRIGCMASLFGTPTMLLSFQSLDFSGSSWRSLIEPCDGNAVGLVSEALAMSLDMVQYASEAPQLKQQLKDELSQNLRQAVLDL